MNNFNKLVSTPILTTAMIAANTVSDAGKVATGIINNSGLNSEQQTTLTDDSRAQAQNMAVPPFANNQPTKVWQAPEVEMIPINKQAVLSDIRRATNALRSRPRMEGKNLTDYAQGLTRQRNDRQVAFKGASGYNVIARRIPISTEVIGTGPLRGEYARPNEMSLNFDPAKLDRYKNTDNLSVTGFKPDEKSELQGKPFSEETVNQWKQEWSVSGVNDKLNQMNTIEMAFIDGPIATGKVVGYINAVQDQNGVVHGSLPRPNNLTATVIPEPAGASSNTQLPSTEDVIADNERSLRMGLPLRDIAKNPDFRLHSPPPTSHNEKNIRRGTLVSGQEKIQGGTVAGQIGIASPRYFPVGSADPQAPNRIPQNPIVDALNGR